uniref:C-type lectin domain-containing protein n=1 Tax=Cyprinus carpio carpio TaxID=630221 RepID=A0A8C1H7I7_CYPCA
MASAAMAGSAADHPLLTEAKKMEYFSSINSMARKIMEEREKIKERYGSAWDQMSPVEQDTAIDDGMLDPRIRARYAMHRVEREELTCYPKLLIQTGQKTVHFGEEDLTWQDEHSAPFSWETKSQMEFSIISGAPEPAVPSSANESKPKPSQSTKLPSTDESSFWKISAERSRLEGEKAEFQSLTPSQIKSLEKGEKPLPSYLRSESGPRESEDTPPSRPVQQRITKPHAPPPPVPISVTPVAISVTPTPPAPVSSSEEGWERAQSTLPSVSTMDDVFSPGLVTRSSSQSNSTVKDADKAESPTFSQARVFNEEMVRGRGDTPDIIEPEPTTAVSEMESTYNYIRCQKGRKMGYKCFLAYRVYETYTDASQKCQERGGRMAMPRDRKEQEALAEYVKSVFHGNWPVWLGINDERSEGLYLFEDTTRVTYFQWRKHFLSSQPDGGKRENCVAMSSDDGDCMSNSLPA